MMTAAKYNVSELLVAGGFLLFGLYLITSGLRLPNGPGFFPLVLGGVTTLLSCGLFLQTLRTNAGTVFKADNLSILLGVILLIGGYLACWGVGSFALRTFILLTILLRMLRESWRTGITVATMLTIGVTLAFKHGLHVSLD